MTGELQQRIDRWLPGDLTEAGEIRAALNGTKWVNELSRGDKRRVVEGVASGRTPDTGAIERDTTQQTTIVGSTDNRQTQLRDESGRVVGKPSNVSKWEDRWGNIMYQNTNTGKRGKLVDSDNR